MTRILTYWRRWRERRDLRALLAADHRVAADLGVPLDELLAQCDRAFWRR